MENQCKFYSHEQILNMLDNNPKAVERGIVAIFNYQTADEQVADTTKYHNNVGFCGWAAKRGSYYAKWVKSGRNLDGSHLDKARKICKHHVGQLVKIANTGKVG